MLREGPVPVLVHGAYEYVVAILLIAAPFLFSFDKDSATASSIVLGLVLLAVTATSRLPTGLTKTLSVGLHVGFDVVFALLLVALPFVFRFQDETAPPRCSSPWVSCTSADHRHAFPRTRGAAPGRRRQRGALASLPAGDSAPSRSRRTPDPGGTMALDPSFAGRTYPPTQPYEVGREKVRGVRRRRRRPEPGVPLAARPPRRSATPTSSRRRPSRSSLSMQAMEQVVMDPDLGLDYSRVVHGEQRFPTPARSAPATCSTSVVSRRDHPRPWPATT